MDNTDTNEKALSVAKDICTAIIEADRPVDGADNIDDPEPRKEGGAVFTLYQFVGGPPASPPRGQWVTKVIVVSEWCPFDAG